MEKTDPELSFPLPKIITDFDLHLEPDDTLYNRQAKISLGNADSGSKETHYSNSDFQLILWLLLEKQFKSVKEQDLSSSASSGSEEDQVDSKKQKLTDIHGAEGDEAKQYTEELLKYVGANVPFQLLSKSEKDALFQQFTASSKLLLHEKFKSSLDLHEALRRRSKFREEFRVNSVIGKGTYGEVFSAELRTKLKEDPGSYQVFAIKRIRLCLDSVEDIHMILNESSTLERLKGHSGIVKIYDSWLALDSAVSDHQSSESRDDSLMFYLQMELCGKTLRQWKNKDLIEKGFRPDEEKCMMILKQLLRALKWIHDNAILHLDINLKNIFWSDNEFKSVKIGDFGLAIEGRSFESRRGTPPYCAPEAIMTEKSDVFSVGVCIFEIAQTIKTRTELDTRLAEATRDISTGMPNVDLLLPHLLSTRPKERLAAAEVLSRLNDME